MAARDLQSDCGETSPTRCGCAQRTARSFLRQRGAETRHPPEEHLPYDRPVPSQGRVCMLVALSAIRVTLDGRRQAEPCPHCRRRGLQGSRRPGVDEFGRRGKYCERCGRWIPDWVPRSTGWVRLV